MVHLQYYVMKAELRKKRAEVKQLEDTEDSSVARTITKVKHQIYDLNYVIEILEEYKDQDW
ncbi:hypothetical protein BS614_25380 [Paenibacillus xylanexedens]|uniref:hypothetical protein n=1 Tax=Paenibacillus xylanexedens TaxID=528191 RepID=UPI0009381807|nr:hypothetical protein [Paenibacillus xylanexedens]APO47054.1 hypothetical protein BS614_25380 [Paenibacillus xylanexedens]